MMQPHVRRLPPGRDGATMRRSRGLVLILLMMGSLATVTTSAAPIRGFGFGGAMGLAFFPDMTGINTFMSENGLPSMGEFLIGVGGGGRGGVIGGTTFGGVGWGGFAISEADGRSAEFAFGGGGFDMGRAIGGDESSVLTLGVVLGGGANVLTLLVPPVAGDGIVPSGVVVEPTYRELVRAIGFVQPYVSMAAQIFPWMGFEVRFGYLLPVFGIDFDDQPGIPAPSLDLSGPTVSFGITFGGIASSEKRDREAERDTTRKRELIMRTQAGSFSVKGVEEVVIENVIGDIRIESYRAEIEGTGMGPRVEWEAVLTSREKDIEGFQVEASVSGLSALLMTTGRGQVDYVLRVPAGYDLRVENGAGTVTLDGHEAQTIILEMGVGEVVVEGVQALALIVAVGFGSADLSRVDAAKLIAEVGVGDIALSLDLGVSATLTAKAKLGDVSIDRFPGMIGGVRGFLGQTGDVTLGEGDRDIELTVGVGQIDVEVREP